MADIAVLKIEEGRFEFEDAHGERVSWPKRFVPQLTLRAGEVWWRR